MVIQTLKKIRALLQFKSSALGLTRIPWPALAHPFSNGLVENCCESFFSLGNLHLLHTQKTQTFQLNSIGISENRSTWAVFYLSLFSLSVWPPVRQSVSQSVRQSVSHSVIQSVSQSGRQSFSQSVSQSVSPSVRQSVSPSVRQSVSLSVRQSVSPSVRQSVSQSVSQSVRSVRSVN